MAGTRIGIVGAGGRMGRMLLEAALKDDGVTLAGALLVGVVAPSDLLEISPVMATKSIAPTG